MGSPVHIQQMTVQKRLHSKHLIFTRRNPIKYPRHLLSRQVITLDPRTMGLLPHTRRTPILKRLHSNLLISTERNLIKYHRPLLSRQTFTEVLHILPTFLRVHHLPPDLRPPHI
jgi:hypothetical protein